MQCNGFYFVGNAGALDDASNLKCTLFCTACLSCTWDDGQKNVRGVALRVQDGLVGNLNTHTCNNAFTCVEIAVEAREVAA